MVAKKQMSTETSPIDAIWNTKLESSAEKMIVYYLVSRHPLCEKFTSTYVSTSQFVGQMQETWTTERELQNATHLSSPKLSKTLESLKTRGLVKTSQRTVRTAKIKEGVDIGPQETIFDITDKIFCDQLSSQTSGKSQKIA